MLGCLWGNQTHADLLALSLSRFPAAVRHRLLCKGDTRERNGALCGARSEAHFPKHIILPSPGLAHGGVIPCAWHLGEISNTAGENHRCNATVLKLTTVLLVFIQGAFHREGKYSSEHLGQNQSDRISELVNTPSISESSICVMTEKRSGYGMFLHAGLVMDKLSL